MKYRLYLISVFFFCSVVAVNSQPKSIISLTPSLTKMIYLLEGEDNLIGCTDFCEPAKADGKEIVASQMSVNIEKIFSMDPDVVITTTLTSSRDIEALNNLGLNVKTFTSPRSFNSLCEQFMEIAELVGREDYGKKIIDREKQRLDSLQQLIPQSKEPRIFMQLGVKPLFSVTRGTFMSDYIKFAGGVNIADGMSKGTITRETVLVRNPDVILIVLMGLVGKEEKQNWQNYRGLKAAENDKIYLVDADKACSPTPVTFVDTVEEIIKFVYLKNK